MNIFEMSIKNSTFSKTINSILMVVVDMILEIKIHSSTEY